MPLVIPLNYASVIHSLRLAGDNEPMAITYGVEVSTVSPPASATSLADDLAGAFSTNIMPRLPSQVTLVNTEVRWQSAAAPADPVIGASGIGGPGVGAPTLLPQNVALLVHKRTALGGRRGRGRLYFPGLAEGDVDNTGGVSSGLKSAWDTNLAQWRNAITAFASTEAMVLLHATSATSATPAPTPITSLITDPVVGTQRRRLRR